jgi:hypothetical protein
VHGYNVLVEWTDGKLIIFFITFGIIIILFITLIIWTRINGISPMPSSRKARREIVSAVAAITGGTTPKPVRIAELGCGWGTLLRPLARKLPGCTFTGYETSPVPYLFTRLSTRFLGLSNIKFFRQDFYRADLDGTDIIVCYLYPGGMEILKDKLTQSPPKPLFYLVSNTFQVYDWRPDSRALVKDLFGSAIYVYKVRLA